MSETCYYLQTVPAYTNISTAMNCASAGYKVRSGGNCQSNPQTFSFTIHNHLLIEKVRWYTNGKRVVIAHSVGWLVLGWTAAVVLPYWRTDFFSLCCWSGPELLYGPPVAAP